MWFPPQKSLLRIEAMRPQSDPRVNMTLKEGILKIKQKIIMVHCYGMFSWNLLLRRGNSKGLGNGAGCGFLGERREGIQGDYPERGPAAQQEWALPGQWEQPEGLWECPYSYQFYLVRTPSFTEPSSSQEASISYIRDRHEKTQSSSPLSLNHGLCVTLCSPTITLRCHRL